MGTITLSMFTSLDGIIETPEEWQGPFWTDEMEDLSFDLLKAADTLLLGRVTYEIFAEAWPVNQDDIGFADRMNALPKLVASRTLPTVEWNSALIEGDIVDGLSKLKRDSDKNMLVYGSADLAQTLIEHDLIDDYRIWVHPVVLGTGKRFRPGDTKGKELRLVGTRVFGKGVVVLSYRRPE